MSNRETAMFERDYTTDSRTYSEMSAVAVPQLSLANHLADRDALQRSFERRLLSLVEEAVTSQALGRQYIKIARKLLRAAREAREMQLADDYELLLREARNTHRKAQKSFNFAGLCERRAECLAQIGGQTWRRSRP